MNNQEALDFVKSYSSIFSTDRNLSLREALGGLEIVLFYDNSRANEIQTLKSAH